MAQPTMSRGSDKLLADLVKKGRQASAQDVKSALSLEPTTEIKILNWHPRGLPPALLEVEAIMETPTQNLGSVVSRLAQSAQIRHINILVNGIPIPDIAQITVIAEAGQ